MRAALRTLGPWKRAVLGGDDIAARTKDAPQFNAKAAQKFGAVLKLEAQRKHYFSFHSLLHCATGSYPDIYKIALKILDRRYTGPMPVRLRQIGEYQIAVRDQMHPFMRNDGLQTGMQLANAAHEVSLEFIDVAWQFILAYLNLTNIFQMGCSTTNQLIFQSFSEFFFPLAGGFVSGRVHRLVDVW